VVVPVVKAVAEHLEPFILDALKEPLKMSA